jgi:quercetin dioxygenase-like cupin family protein
MSVDIAELIGRNIRKFRREKLVTLQELAEKSDVSVSMLSKVENSRSLPPISTYVKIASALGKSFSDLTMEDAKNEETSLVRASERPVISKGPYIGSPLAYKRREKRMEPFLLEYPYRRTFPKHSHAGNEEMVFVLRGTIEFKYGEDVLILREGDCFYFNGGVVHGARAVDPGGATALIVQSFRND